MSRSTHSEIARFTRAQRERQERVALLRYQRAIQLDREADHQLHMGLHLAAERLAHRAAELREVVR